MYKLALLLCALSCLHAQAPGAPATRAREVLNVGAADKDPETRRQVAIALSLIRTRDPAAELLKNLAKDRDALVREAAIVTVAELKDRKLIPVAQAALDDDVPEVAFAAARALFQFNQPDGKRLLIDVVEKETKAKSGFVRAKLRDISRRMKRPGSAVLFVARQSIGFVPVPGLGEGFSALSSLVADADFSARATALLILAPDNSPDVRAAIEEAFNDSDWSMRAAAIQIAAARNDRRWRSRLIPLCEDTNRRVRFRAAASYLRLEQTAGARPTPVAPPRK